MKRAMGVNHTLKHNYLMASSMWPLKNKLFTHEILYYFIIDHVEH